MNRLALDRRRFLKLVGATAFTYPFLRGTPSFAAGAPATPYLVLAFTPCGVVRYKWGAQGPAPTGASAAVTSGLVFRDTLSAFAKAGPMKVDLSKYVTVLDGLTNKAAGGGTHEAGFASLYSGADVANNSTITPSPTIDQAIAPLLKSQQSVNTPYPTIQLMAQSSADYQERSIQTRMLYDASGNYVDPITSPAAALSSLFPSAMASSTSSGPDKTTFLRQKVAAQVNSDLTSLQGRLCTQDRQQLQNLQDVYNQILAQLASAATAAAACSTPQIATGSAGSSGSSGSSGGSGSSGSNGQNNGQSSAPDPFPQNIAAMGQILAMALACDLTRVASLQLSHALSPVTHSWLPSVASSPNTHHNYSHMGPSWMGALGPDLYNETADVTSQYPQQLIDIDAWYAQQIASFAYTLSQLKPGVGSGSLLDQSVIVVGSEIDMGASHNHDDTPFLLLGLGGGTLKGNQLVRFPLATGNNAGQPVPGLRYHNDLLLTLAKVMGVTLPGGTFGDPTFCKGVIAEVLA